MEACEEAHAVDAGRFNGLCSHQYEHVVNGFSAQASTASASASQDSLTLLQAVLTRLQPGSSAWPQIHKNQAGTLCCTVMRGRMELDGSKASGSV